MGDPCSYADGTSILDTIVDRLMSRDRRKVDNLPDWVDGQGNTENPERYIVLGQHVAWVAGKAGGYKIVDARVWPYSDAELARPYLDAVRKVNGMGKVRWRRDQLPLLSLRVPMLYTGPVEGELCHVDIASAYWQIWRRVSLAVDYRPGRFLAPGKAEWLEPDHIAHHKDLRVVLAGIIRSSRIRTIRSGVIFREPARSELLAPSLWGLTMHVLHEIAGVALAGFGALYWDTDGGIFRPDDGERFVRYLDETWGFLTRSNHDDSGQIKAWKRYRVGDTSTVDAKMDRRPHRIRNLLVLEPDQSKLLRALSERATSAKASS